MCMKTTQKKIQENNRGITSKLQRTVVTRRPAIGDYINEKNDRWVCKKKDLVK